MQNMHKSTHDRPLTGVHWPIHRGWCRGSGPKGDLSTSTGGSHRRTGWRTDYNIIIYMYTRTVILILQGNKDRNLIFPLHTKKSYVVIMPSIDPSQ